MKIGTLAMVAALCLVSSGAMAATPRLSGNYALSMTQNCQVTVGSDTYDNIDVAGGSTITLANLFDRTVNDGKFSQTVGIATFNLTTHTLSFSGTEVKGSVLLVPGLSGADESMSSSPLSGSFSYSVPDTTSLVFGGITYSAAYGNIVSGTARYVTFVTQDPSKPECYDYGTAVHQ